jgi:hypothetical protein
MVRKKKMLSLLAASSLVAACGGGGDGGLTTPSTSPATGSTAPTAPTTPTPPVGSGGGSTTAPTPGTPATPTTPAPAPAVDQTFNGIMELVGNQILYIPVNRALYLPVNIRTTLETDTGIVDMASGSPIAPIPNLAADAAAKGCTIAIDKTCGIQPSAAAPSAPIAGFGIRVGTNLLPSAAGEQVGNQTVVGRIAYDLTELADSPGIGVGEVPEIARFVIDNVEMATDATGQLTSVRLKEGAQLHVYGRNAAGVEVRESIPAPPNTVRLLPLTQIPDANCDTTSVILFMDLEAGFSQAGQKLAALDKIAGHFAMHVTLSSVKQLIRRVEPTTPASPVPPPLVGQSITVNTQPPVTGAGLNGNAWIRMYPPR